MTPPSPKPAAGFSVVELALSVTQSELRGKAFEGVVARTAASIDPATCTMQIEVALPRRGRKW